MADFLSTQMRIRRVVIDAVFIALFVLFSAVLTVKTPFAEISLASLPILLCAYLFGPADALIVAALGSFMEQVFSLYGLSVTTPLWMTPVILQAAVASLGFWVVRRVGKPWIVIVVLVIAELVLTFANTAALYLDGYIFSYAVKALHLLLPTRLLNGGVRLALSCVLFPLLLRPLRAVAQKK